MIGLGRGLVGIVGIAIGLCFTGETTFASPTQLPWVTPVGNFSNELNYLALGDSFSSGEGEKLDGYYLLGTNEPTAKCHTSTRSYPFIVAQVQSLSAVVRSVTCSGAQTIDIVGSGVYRGQGGRLSAFSDHHRQQRQSDALHWFRPGELRQVDFVARYQPRTVSIGIGGNDVGMFDKLKACLMPVRCEWVADTYRIQMAREIRSLFPRLIAMYAQLRRASPETRFYIIDYPQIINARGFACDPLLDHLLDTVERELLVQAIDYLNEVLRAAAKWAAFKLISLEDAFWGNKLCDVINTTMNGVVVGDDTRIISAAGQSLWIGNESFHPTPFGHQLIAQIVTQAMPINSPKRGAVSGDERTVAPQIPVYWQDNGRQLAALIKYPMSVGETIIGGNVVNLVFASGSFVPNALVSVLIRSEERELVRTYADAEGGLRVEVLVPKNLSEGYHTLVARGMSGGNELTDYYQIVYYGNPESEIIAHTEQVEIEGLIEQVLGAVDDPTHSKIKQRNVPSESSSNMVYVGIFSIVAIILCILLLRFVRRCRAP